MQRLLNLIEKNNVCHKEAPLKTVDVIKTQKELVKLGCPFLPVEYIDFLKQYNGVSSSDCAILGIPPLDDDRLNIVEYNSQFNASSDITILGYDDDAYLVYDNQENNYKLVERTTMQVLEVYSNDELVYALNSILHI